MPPLKLTIERTVLLPDRLGLARLARAPELGPRVLFFSGGSALAGLSRVLINYTHNSIHLITPFDSGGSSAKIREAFAMPAVGDLRNRMMALADQSVQGNPDIYLLFAHRLSREESPRELAAQLDQMIRGVHPLTAAVPDPMRKIIRNHLGYFRASMPPDFDLGGASIGNLVLTGGYLNNRCHLDPVIFLFSKLAEVRGMVRPVVSADLHLVAVLEDGSRVVGQHNLTGREKPPIKCPVKDLHLTDNLENPVSVKPAIRQKVRDMIASAELIVYPMGSFYSSLVANLLPLGVASAIAENHCPKVFIPNTGFDKEMPGQSAAAATRKLLAVLRAGAGEDTPVDQLLNLVLVDSSQGDYPGGLDLPALEAMGPPVIDLPLADAERPGELAPRALAEVVMSLV